MKLLKNIFVLILALSLASCASFDKKLKAWLNGDQPNQGIAAQGGSQNPRDQLTTFADHPNMPVPQDREYHRKTKKQFEEEELFSDNAGSLWVMEGQDSYLFAQNIVRLPGDILNVQLDGQPEKQLSTKAHVIKELTDKIEKAKQREVAGQPSAAPAAAPAAPGAEKQAAAVPGATPKPDEKSEESAGNFDVKTIPTRVVERMSDGSYRVKGAQTFMIGSKEYRVIVTGLVKPSDITDDSISSSKMVDSHFDIIRYTKGRAL